MEKYQDRGMVPEKYKWDLTSFFKDEDEFNKVYKETEEMIDKLSDYVGCTKDSNKLLEFIKLEFDTIANWEDLYVYSYLINDEVVGISSNIERKDRTESLYLKFNNATAFFAPELLKLTKEEFEELKNNEGLKEYYRYLEDIYREKEHILSENEEVIINELVNSMNSFSDMSSNLLNSEHDYGKVTLDDGEEVVLSPTNYGNILKNASRDLRKKVREQFNNVLDQYSTSNAMYLNSYVKMNTSLAKIRKYKSSWDAKLYELNMNNDVFDALVSAVEEKVDVFRKKHLLRKKMMNLDELHFYDLAPDLVKCDKEYSIEDAQDLIKNALSPLGDEYLSCINKIFDKRYIDYCQYKGKASGGYSFSTMKQDSRVLLSFNGDLESVSTIIHEAGHNVHYQYLRKNNPIQYVNVSEMVCEVASLTNECLLSSYLAENGTSKEEKLAGIENILDVINSNLFGAVREGKMEVDFYNHVLNGGALTKDYLDKLTNDSISKYYGDIIVRDEHVKNGWVNRSHYYMHFYLFSYAICVCVASYVAKNILDGNKDLLDKYYEFLGTGSDVWPIDAFKVLGIDLTDKQVYLDAIDYYESMIDKYEEIANS